jgi:AraC-like DNA-binding protein
MTTQLQLSVASEPNLAERFDLISDCISENFRAPWHAEPVGSQHRPATMSWACADGVVVSRAQMSPMRLVNDTPCRHAAPKYYTYTSNQAALLKVQGRPHLHVQPEEFLILSSDLACEWIVPHDYTTSCFIIDSVLFHEYVPNAEAMVARRLSVPFGLDSILHATLNSAWAASCAGLFEDVGPKLARAFLHTLSAASPTSDFAARGRAKTSLEIRRAQVRAFIERHYASPDLAVADIARHLHLSQRYLQMAFESEDLTPSEYLRNCRLTACAKLLRDPQQASRTITEISFACGFNSSAHFSTEFRRAYGMSPRRYRSAATEGELTHAAH